MSNICDRCGGEGSEEAHPCPFEEEINDDHNPEYCTCCDDCTQGCKDDI